MNFSVFMALLLVAKPSCVLAHDNSYRLLRADSNYSKSSTEATKSSKSAVVSAKAGKFPMTKASKGTRVQTSAPTKFPVTLKPSVPLPSGATMSPSVSSKPTDATSTQIPTLSPTTAPSDTPSYDTEPSSFSIRNPHTSKLLSIKNGECAEGNTIELFEDVNADWQLWTFDEVHLSVESVACPGFVIDLGNGDDSECSNGEALIISPKQNKTSQAWHSGRDGIIENLKCLDLVVDIEAYGTHDGAKIYLWRKHGEWNEHVWSVHGTWNQQWVIQHAGSIPYGSPTASPKPTLSSNRKLRTLSKSSKINFHSSMQFPSLAPTVTNRSAFAALFGCKVEECLDPAGLCGAEVKCLIDPCRAIDCDENEHCTPNFCGGCHAVCSRSVVYHE